MKLLTIAALLITSLFIASCQKTDQNEVTINYYMKATKNDKAWAALNLTSLKKTNNDTLTIKAQAIPEGSALPDETLIITLVANNEGQYQPIRNKTAYITTVGLDVVTNTYVLTTESTNTITITDLDEEDKTLKGSFNLKFKNANPKAPATDVITFKSGDFFSNILYQ
ncbi:DUF6252 family protein [Mucilaginibacter terrae]|uniref:DUF6252 family protein n=1 Tax=Mucilaginibacter terrae TaxID=1955052 RepID=UPI003645EAC8